MKKRTAGSISIEVAISFVIFISIIIVFLSFINHARIYGKIQYALCQSAKELANFSYVYSATGLYNKEIAIENSVETQEVDNIAVALAEIFDLIEDSANSAAPTNLKEIVKEMQQLYGNTTTIIENLQQLAEEPEKLYISLLYLSAQESLTFLKNQVLIGIVKAIMPKYLAVHGVDSFLTSFHIVRGFQGLDFSNSTFLADNQSIELVVQYQIGQGLPFLPSLPIKFTNRATTRAWLNGDGTKFDVATLAVTSDAQSIWQMTDYFARGKVIIEAEKQKYQYSIINTPGLHALNEGVNGIEIIRITSYDATKSTNNTANFSEVIDNHKSIMKTKLLAMSQVIAESNETKNIKLFAIIPSGLRTKLIVVVPEDTDAIEYAEMMAIVSEINYDDFNCQVCLQRGYGMAKTVEMPEEG